MAEFIKPDGTVKIVYPKAQHFTLREMQELVGGYIEIIPLGQGRQMVIDEEGKLKGLEPNIEASTRARLAGALWTEGDGHGMGTDYVAGPALFVTNDELDGDNNEPDDDNAPEDDPIDGFFLSFDLETSAVIRVPFTD